MKKKNKTGKLMFIKVYENWPNRSQEFSSTNSVKKIKITCKKLIGQQQVDLSFILKVKLIQDI